MAEIIRIRFAKVFLVQMEGCQQIVSEMFVGQPAVLVDLVVRLREVAMGPAHVVHPVAVVLVVVRRADAWAGLQGRVQAQGLREGSTNCVSLVFN